MTRIERYATDRPGVKSELRDEPSGARGQAFDQETADRDSTAAAAGTSPKTTLIAVSADTPARAATARPSRSLNGTNSDAVCGRRVNS